MIQGVVDRLSGHGASSKTFCITIVTATLGLASALKMPNLAALGAAQVVGFALIDAQYLSVERRYRQLFDRVRSGAEQRSSFDLSAGPPTFSGFWKALRSWSILGFYSPALLGVAIAYAVLERAYE
jgi:hypothetical protein